jgi:hypothetical protein
VLSTARITTAKLAKLMNHKLMMSESNYSTELSKQLAESVSFDNREWRFKCEKHILRKAKLPETDGPNALLACGEPCTRHPMRKTSQASISQQER